jgi:predicted dehydrogenase
VARQVGVGLVGLGVVSVHDILPNLVLPEVQERLKLVAVCDIDETRARDGAGMFDVPKWYTDAAELAADPDVEIVAIATPVAHHLAPALAAIAAGKHVYLQKTMTLDVADADELIAAGKKAGVIMAAAPGNHLRSPSVKAIRKHLDNGDIGKVCWGRAQKGTRHDEDARRQPGGTLEEVDPSWYYKPGGGPLRDAAVYDIQNVTYLLGPAKRVTAMSGIALPTREWKDKVIKVEMDDNTHFILDFGESRYVVFSSHFIRGSRQVPSLELYGEWGSIFTGGRAEGGYELYKPSQNRDRGGFVEERVEVGAKEPVGSAHGGFNHYIVGDLAAIADSIDHGTPIEFTAEQARHVVEIIDKVYESARLGATLDLETTFDWA